MTDAVSVWVLKGIAGEFRGNSLPMTLPIMTLGRTSQNHIMISDTNISRVHATFFVEGDAIFVKDEGSRNGVFVNEKKIVPDQKIQLSHGDRIFVGPHAFVMEQEVRPGTANIPTYAQDLHSTKASNPEPTAYTSTKKTLFPFPLPALSLSRRTLMYTAVGIVILMVLISKFSDDSAKKNPAKNSATVTAPISTEVSPNHTPLHMSEDEIDSLKAQAKAAMEFHDYLAATELYGKIIRAEPANEYARNQYVFAKNALEKQINLHLELAKREYEKLNFERAIIEWKQVMALTIKFNPEIYRQTETKINDTEKELRKRK